MDESEAVPRRWDGVAVVIADAATGVVIEVVDVAPTSGYFAAAPLEPAGRRVALSVRGPSGWSFSTAPAYPPPPTHSPCRAAHPAYPRAPPIPRAALLTPPTLAPHPSPVPRGSPRHRHPNNTAPKETVVSGDECTPDHEFQFALAGFDVHGRVRVDVAPALDRERG